MTTPGKGPRRSSGPRPGGNSRFGGPNRGGGGPSRGGRPGKPGGFGRPAKPSAPKKPQPPARESLVSGLTSQEALAPTTEFLDATKAMGLELEEADLKKLGLYLAMLLEMNERMNLTAITEPAAAWMRHAFDALTLVGHLAGIEEDVAAERGVPMRVVDVGSGGGVPGVPLAVVMPSVRFTLLEPTGKKAEFLRHVVSVLELKNVEVVCDRAERAAGDRATYRELFDAAVVRAVGHVSEIAELCVGFVGVGGAVLAIKGQRAEQEVQEAQKALATLFLEHAGTSPTPTGQIVALMKTQRTPRIYPRHDGEPKRRPLGLASKEAEREGKGGKAG